MVHNCFASTGVNGAKLFAFVEYHTTYAVKLAQRAGAIIHRLDMNISNMFFTLCIFVVHGYNMSQIGHIVIGNMLSYDINVLDH
jgi:hypothetical protein